MSNWREGDRVRVVRRAVTEEDRKNNAYFEHMADLTGKVSAVFAEDQVCIVVDTESLPKVSRDVHKNATKRMREEFLPRVSEEQKKLLTSEELNFDANFVILAKSDDLVKV